MVSTNTEIYPILAPNDPDFIPSIFGPMQDTFYTKAQEDALQWRATTQGCPENCRCIVSTEPKDVIRSHERISCL